MTDTPTDQREAAGLIPAELLDGRPKPRTAWVAVEAIDGVSQVTKVTQVGVGLRIGVFTLTLRGGQTVECSDTESTSEPTPVNLERTAARREAILDLWAAARLKAKGVKP